MAGVKVNINTIQWTHLTEVLNRLGDYFIEQARNNILTGGNPPYTNNNATGTLSNSMQKIVQIGEDEFSVSVSIAEYWKYLNYDTRPHWPNVGAIRQWIEVKPVKPRVDNGKRLPTVDQLAFLIGRKISIEGTKGTHFFDKAKDDTLAYYEEAIDLAITEDVDEYIVSLVDYEELWKSL